MKHPSDSEAKWDFTDFGTRFGEKACLPPAQPVVVCPEANLAAVRQLAPCVGLHLWEDMQELREIPVSMGVICFTTDASLAPRKNSLLKD